MFSNIQPVAGDPIFALGERCRRDPRTDKIDLTVGVYRDATGKVPLLPTVHATEQRLAAEGAGRSYLPIEGLEAYRAATQRLLFGTDAEVLRAGRVATIQTIGGSGALRIGADFLRATCPGSDVWISDPAYANHRPIFAAAGLATHDYPYYDRGTRCLSFDRMLEVMRAIPHGDIVLLHGCCHNPSGSDLDHDQWQTLMEVMTERDLLPFIDLAYQGFATGLDEDAWVVRTLADTGRTFLVASSFSKNFSLYSERCGALSIVCDDATAAAAVLGNLSGIVRRSYSDPPEHGARLIAEILGDASLRASWRRELAGMRERILHIRQQVVEQLASKAPDYDASYVLRQRGLFSLTGLSLDELERLRREHAIYLVDSGRMSLPGLNDGNIERFTDALAAIVKQAAGTGTA